MLEGRLVIPASQISPIQVFTPFGSVGSKIAVHAFGRPHDWSLSNNPHAGAEVASIAARSRVFDIRAPIPDFSARLCLGNEFEEWQRYHVVGGRDAIIHRGTMGDATEVKQNSAFFLASADCPTLIVFDPVYKILYCAHAGRDCVWDRNKVLNSAAARPFESVVDAIMHGSGQNERSHLQAFICGGVAGRNFAHPEEGEFAQQNSKMISYIAGKWGSVCFVGNPCQGRLSVKTLIRQQLVAQGLQLDNIGCDTIDTFSDMDEQGTYRWWSNRRGDKKERNGVLVVYK